MWIGLLTAKKLEQSKQVRGSSPTEKIDRTRWISSPRRFGRAGYDDGDDYGRKILRVGVLRPLDGVLEACPEE